MDNNKKIIDNSNQGDVEVRKGPWTMEEDLILINYIANHGEGVWNSLAKAAGLKRTGKSCRLRWLNYLRPDVRRGNITPEEQLIIMELHAKWGNRWSKIAKHLPGRTDNEIKNYWRTRIQKHIRQADQINTNNNNNNNNNSNNNNNDHSKSSEMMMMFRDHHHHHQASTSQGSSSIDPMETYSSPIIASSYQGNNYNNIINHHHHHQPNINNYPNNIALPPPTTASNDQNYNWSIEDIWSMQLLGSD